MGQDNRQLFNFLKTYSRSLWMKPVDKEKIKVRLNSKFKLFVVDINELVVL